MSRSDIYRKAFQLEDRVRQLEAQIIDLEAQLQSVRADLHLTLKTNVQLLDTIEKLEQEKKK